jgi:hypothetical protein
MTTRCDYAGHEWKERDDSPDACIERVCLNCDRYESENRDEASWRLFGTDYDSLNPDEQYLVDNGGHHGPQAEVVNA